MKTLGKLKINSEKILKNEELVVLRGGYVANCNATDPQGACNYITPGQECCYNINGQTKSGFCNKSGDGTPLICKVY